MKRGRFFTSSAEESERKTKQPRILKEEKLLIDAIRKITYSELRDGLREDHGANFTEDMTEQAFELLVEECRSSGLMKQMLDEYLQKKIQNERQKFQNSVPQSKSTTKPSSLNK